MKRSDGNMNEEIVIQEYIVAINLIDNMLGNNSFSWKLNNEDLFLKLGDIRRELYAALCHFVGPTRVVSKGENGIVVS